MRRIHREERERQPHDKAPAAWSSQPRECSGGGERIVASRTGALRTILRTPATVRVICTHRGSRLVLSHHLGTSSSSSPSTLRSCPLRRARQSQSPNLVRPVPHGAVDLGMPPRRWACYVRRGESRPESACGLSSAPADHRQDHQVRVIVDAADYCGGDHSTLSRTASCEYVAGACSSRDPQPAARPRRLHGPRPPADLRDRFQAGPPTVGELHVAPNPGTRWGPGLRARRGTERSPRTTSTGGRSGPGHVAVKPIPQVRRRPGASGVGVGGPRVAGRGTSSARRRTHTTRSGTRWNGRLRSSRLRRR